MSGSTADAPLEGVEACVFDAYGTLFDVHSAVGALAARVGPEHARLSEAWRRRQLEYTWLRSLSGAWADFRAVTADALAVSMRELGLGDPGPVGTAEPRGARRDEGGREGGGRDGGAGGAGNGVEAGVGGDGGSARALHAALMRAYETLDAFPEVPGALRAIGRAGLPRAILSNGTPEMLDAAVSAAGLDAELEHVLSVDALGTYKPVPQVYALATDALGLSPARVAFLSSNAWDAAGAARFGFRTVWVNRAGAVREALPGDPERELADLGALPALLGLDGAVRAGGGG